MTGAVDHRGVDPEDLIRDTAQRAPSRENLETLLAAVAARNGAAAPRIDDDGTVVVSLADEVELTLLHRAGVSGFIAAAPMPDRLAGDPDLLLDLLCANLDWHRTAGATFAKLPDGGPCVLCGLIPASGGASDRDVQAFEKSLLDFATRAADWIDELELALDLAGDDRAAEPRPASGPPPAVFA
ncbi:MAG: type III secretion system chaperone [Chromatiaceae bacterium]|nr:type III secretion system chaperone [Chromatiaceae bacterium]MCP5315867.1 type III secretion system chaperone [Chromatiaceae bacterium]